MPPFLERQVLFSYHTPSVWSVKQVVKQLLTSMWKIGLEPVVWATVVCGLLTLSMLSGKEHHKAK